MDDKSFPIVTEDDDDTDTAPPTMVAVPELTHPGESQTNGLAERSIRTLEEQTRVHLAALEARIKIQIPSQRPMLAWIVEHAAYILNLYQIGRDSKTAYGRLHGKRSTRSSAN